MYLKGLVSLADVQPLSMAKTNVFHRQRRFYRRIYHSVKVHAGTSVGFVDLFRDSASFRRVKFRVKYFHINR